MAKKPVTPTFSDALRSEEHTSELQSRQYRVCRLLLEKTKTYTMTLSSGVGRGHNRAGRMRSRQLMRDVAGHPQRPRPQHRLPQQCPDLFFFLNKGGPPEFPPFPHREPLPN